MNHAMIFLVRRMRVRGVPLSPQQLRKEQEIRGDVRVNHESCVLGRASVIATLKSGQPLSEPDIPELLDASLHSMAPNAFVLSGIEVVDGVAYAQSWICSAE